MIGSHPATWPSSTQPKKILGLQCSPTKAQNWQNLGHRTSFLWHQPWAYRNQCGWTCSALVGASISPCSWCLTSTCRHWLTTHLIRSQVKPLHNSFQSPENLMSHSWFQIPQFFVKPTNLWHPLTSRFPVLGCWLNFARGDHNETLRPRGAATGVFSRRPPKKTTGCPNALGSMRPLKSLFGDVWPQSLRRWDR